MAKELHIKIDKQIGGLFIDEMGWLSAGYSAAELDYALSEMPEPKRLIIHASSPGGDIEQGFAIYNRLLDLKKNGTEIHVINEAKAYSIMTFIAMAASPGKLFARKASMWSVHKPMVITEPYAALNADELRKYAAELDSFEGVIVDAYAARTGKDKKALAAMLREDVIINSDEALAQGWIDAILDAESQTAEPAKMVAWKPLVLNHKSLTIKETNKEMAVDPKDAGFVAKVKAFAMEILNMKPEGEETPEQPEQPEVTEVPETPEQPNQPDPKDAEIERLKAELEKERGEKTEALTALNTANDAMVHMKTTFVPQSRQNNFKKEGDNTPAENDIKSGVKALKEKAKQGN